MLIIPSTIQPIHTNQTIDQENVNTSNYGRISSISENSSMFILGKSKQILGISHE